jgi:ribonucleotide reductase beta subunit family protein with ferritin-like domain
MFPVFTLTIYEDSYINQFNETIHIYLVLYNMLTSKLGKFCLAESIIKEVIFLLILLSLNSYILFNLIQIGRRKKRLTTNSSSVQNINRAENRKIIMITVLFITFLLGHLPNFLFFAFSNGYSDSFGVILNVEEKYSFIFHIQLHFFVYFFFNNIFKRLFLQQIHFRSLN